MIWNVIKVINMQMNPWNMQMMIIKEEVHFLKYTDFKTFCGASLQ